MLPLPRAQLAQPLRPGRLKVRKYALHEPGGYDFTPLVTESYGRQCKSSHALLNKLGHQASDSGRVTKGSWGESRLRRLSVALCKGNAFLFRSNLPSFRRAAAKHPRRLAVAPHILEV